MTKHQEDVIKLLEGTLSTIEIGLEKALGERDLAFKSLREAGNNLDAMTQGYNILLLKALREQSLFRSESETKYQDLLFQWERDQTIIQDLRLDAEEMDVEYSKLYHKSREKIAKLKKKAKRLRAGKSPSVKEKAPALKEAPADRSWLKAEPERWTPRHQQEWDRAAAKEREFQRRLAAETNGGGR